MELEDLRVYESSMEIGSRVWGIVAKWDFFARDTVGKQLVRATDFVAANLSEGFGRFHYKETGQFGYYARGSLYETKTWVTKGHDRGLISDSDFQSLRSGLENIGVKLNNYIRSVGSKKQDNDQK